MKIGLTIGDPAGIGPEVIRGALASGRITGPAELEIIGNAEGHVPGRPTKESAKAAAAALDEAARRLINGELAGVVTGPVSKHALHAIEWSYPGQTEFFAARARTDDYSMCLTGGTLTVALVTAHIPLRDVPMAVNASGIARTCRLLAAHLRRLGIQRPRIAVAGLNPHAGEDGDIGSEEIDVISPAVRELSAEATAEITGPLPPDTVFFRAAAGEFDGVVCMYHDQGLIPLKLLAFDSGVNITLGLPFVRTSPDHGTAFDIAGSGKARPDSMIAAINLAQRLVARAQ